MFVLCVCFFPVILTSCFSFHRKSEVISVELTDCLTAMCDILDSDRHILRGPASCCFYWQHCRLVRGLLSVDVVCLCHLQCSDFQVLHASWKILEIYLQGHGKSWKLLGSLSGNFQTFRDLAKRQWCGWQILTSNMHVSADKNSHNCCHQVRFLGCGYVKDAAVALPWTDPDGEAYSASKTL